MSCFLHWFLRIALWERCWAKWRACQKHGQSATLPFPSTASCQSGSQQAGNAWRTNLQVPPLTLTWPMGTPSSSKIRPRWLKSNVCNQKLVLKVWPGRQWVTEVRRTSGARLFILQGVARPEHWANLVTACLYSFPNVTERYFATAPSDQRRLCCKSSPPKCCDFLASACSSSVHVSISRTSNHGYVNPQILVVNYDNHCIGIFSAVL